MIDFKNPKPRIVKFTVEEGDFYLLDISTLERDRIIESAKDDAEIFFGLLNLTLCNEHGKLVGMDKETFESLARGLQNDIYKAVSKMNIGEKKS